MPVRRHRTGFFRTPRLRRRHLASPQPPRRHPAAPPAWYHPRAHGLPWNHQFLPPFHPHRRHHPPASQRRPSGQPAPEVGGDLVWRHGYSVPSGQGRPLRRHHPGTSSADCGDGSHGRRLRRPCRSFPTAADDPQGSLATLGIFLKKAVAGRDSLLGFRQRAACLRRRHPPLPVYVRGTPLHSIHRP